MEAHLSIRGLFQVTKPVVVFRPRIKIDGTTIASHRIFRDVDSAVQEGKQMKVYGNLQASGNSIFLISPRLEIVNIPPISTLTSEIYPELIRVRVLYNMWMHCKECENLPFLLEKRHCSACFIGWEKGLKEYLAVCLAAVERELGIFMEMFLSSMLTHHNRDLLKEICSIVLIEHDYHTTYQYLSAEILNTDALIKAGKQLYIDIFIRPTYSYPILEEIAMTLLDTDPPIPPPANSPVEESAQEEEAEILQYVQPAPELSAEDVDSVLASFS